MLKTADFHVVSDVTLENATEAEVRRRFRAWTASEGKEELEAGLSSEDFAWVSCVIPRYTFCIHVDEASMRSVLNTAPLDNAGYGNLIRADQDWFSNEYPQCDIFDWSKHTKFEDESQQLNENEEQLEGCRLFDVGWSKLSHFSLGYIYARLAEGHWEWDNIYKRPSSLVRL